MSSLSPTNNNPTEEVTMSTATKNIHRKFGAAAPPVSLDGAFAEYAKPDLKNTTRAEMWCEWFYNGRRNQWVVRMNLGRLEFQVTETETEAIAVAAWNILCDAVESHREIMNQPEL